MHQVVTLWDMAQKQDVDGLSAHIQWDGNAILYDSHPELSPRATQRHYGSFSLLHDQENNPSGFRLTRRFTADEKRREVFESGFPRAKLEGDVIHRALYCVQSFVNEHLKDVMLLRLEWNSDSTASVLHVNSGLSSLWDAFWYQFAETIADKIEVTRKCVRPGCSVILENPRANRNYCSDACGMKAYRKRPTYHERKRKAEHL